MAAGVLKLYFLTLRMLVVGEIDCEKKLAHMSGKNIN